MRACAIRRAARRMSAPGATTTGFLPPSSSVTGTRCWAADRCTRAPTDGEPVKKRWSNGKAANAAATSGPPVTTCSSSDSKYSGASDAIRSAVCEVTSDILIIARLPAANAVAAGRTTRLSGKFHGPMIPITPSGEGWTSARRPHSRAARISLVGRIH
ncbi:hypothetical protein A5620_25375 [Mycobacterium colombiense]|nr:hypothetical protein A5620_25375 [Mycobacterium colombiense]